MSDVFCYSCHTEQPIGNFFKHRGTDRTHEFCKSCFSKYNNNERKLKQTEYIISVVTKIDRIPK